MSRRQNAESIETMKKTLLLAATVAGIFTFGASAHAGDALLSPKAKAFADSLRTVPGTTPDLIDRSVRAGSPKGLELGRCSTKGVRHNDRHACTERACCSSETPGQ